MALPKVEVEITADTRRAEAGFDRVEKGMAGVGAAADRASSRTDRLGTTLNRNTGRSSAFGRGIQNASFQLGDFATQVGAGTSASIALGQQLPQLLGGFGILGAVLGAVVAVAVPLTRAFQGLAGDSENLERALGTLSPAAGAIADAFRTVRDMGVQMAEVIINNLDRIVVVGGTVAAYFAGRWVASFVGAFYKARVATLTLKTAINGLKAAMLRFLPTAVFIAIGELIFQFTRLVEAAGGFRSAMKLLGDVAKGVWKGIKEGAKLIPDALKGVWMLMKSQFLSALADMADGWATFIKGIADTAPDWLTKGVTMDVEPRARRGRNPAVTGGEATLIPSPFAGMFGDDVGSGASDLAERLRSRAGELQGEAGGIFSTVGAGMGDAFGGAIGAIGKIREMLAGMKEENLSLPDILGVGTGEDGEGAGGGGGQDRDASPLVQGLANAREQLEMWYAEMKEMLESASEDELSVIGGYNEAKLRLEEEYQRRLRQIKQKGAMAEVNTVIDSGQKILQAMGQNNKKALQIASAFGAAKALINTLQGASEEIAKGGLIGLAKAAAVIAAGMNLVNSIKSIGSSGATGGAMGGFAGGFGAPASAAAPAAPAQPEVSRSVAIRLEGDTFGRDRVISLINEINEAVEDGAVVRLA